MKSSKPPDIICCGMALVDVLVSGFSGMPVNSDIAYVSGVSLSAGGDAINQAIAASKLGSRVGLWTVLGNDVQGKYVRDECAKFRINTDGVVTDRKLSTTTSIVMIEASGERCFLTPRSGSMRSYGPKHIRLQLIKKGLRVFSIGSLFCSSDFDTQALKFVLKKAKSVGSVTMADFIANEGSNDIDRLADIFPLIDYVAPSETEGQICTGQQIPSKIANTFRKLGAKNVILKRGAEGIMMFSQGEVITLRAFPTKAVDTTGAGDNFMGGFAHGIAKGFEVKDALYGGLAAAALSIQAVGAGAGLVNKAQFRTFLKANQK